MSNLHVFDVYGGEEELVIAESAEDARALCAENVSADELTKATFEQYPDDWPLPFREEEDKPAVTKACSEWAKQYGRGHFATTYT